jgi:hypothetical protein
VKMSYTTEALVAKVYGGKTMPHVHPVDVVTKSLAIEVKSFDYRAKQIKCRMEKEAIKDKERWCKRNRKRMKTVLCLIKSKTTVLYEREGFGNYRIENMTIVGEF